MGKGEYEMRGKYYYFYLCTQLVIYTNKGNIQFKCTGGALAKAPYVEENTAPWLIVSYSSE